MAKYGSTIHIDMHVIMPWHMTVKEQRNEVCEIIALIRSVYGESTELSVTSDPCGESLCSSCRYGCEERKADFIKVAEWNINNLSTDIQHTEVCEDDN